MLEEITGVHIGSLSYFEEGADLLFALDSMNQSLVRPIRTDKTRISSVLDFLTRCQLPRNMTVLHRDELKSEMCGLSAEPKLSTSYGFFVAAVKDGFVVSLFRAEQVIHNACEFVSCGGDCLRFAELPSDPPKELAEIIFGVMQRLRGHAQRSGNAAPAAATLG
jgi:hypothetical protein